MVKIMDEKTLRVLVENGAVKKVSIVGQGGILHIEIITSAGNQTATTLKGKLKTWSSLDSAAKWVKSLGVGFVNVNLEKWVPSQKAIKL